MLRQRALCPRAPSRCGLPILLLVFALTGLSGAAAGEEPGGEPPCTPVIRAVRFEGVHALPRKALRAHLFTPFPSWKPWVPRPPLSEAVVERDAERIVGLYRRHGYYRAEARAELRWDESRCRAEVVFHVEEGEPVRLAELRVELARPVDDPPDLERLVQEDLPLRPGDVFSVRAYGAARQEVLARLANQGYPRAQLTGGAEVDPEAGRATVHWTVDPGPLVRFGPVSVSGLERVSEELVLREITVREGRRFSLDALQETRERIYDVGLFRAVIVRPRPPAPMAAPGAGPQPGAGESPAPAATPGPGGPPPGEPGVPETQIWPVEIAVTERPLRSVRLGVGWGTEDGPRAQAGWVHRNWLGGARRLEIEAQQSNLLTALTASLDQRHFLGRKILFGADLSLRQERDPGFTADRALSRVELRRTFGRRWSARIAHQLEWNRVTDAADDTGAVLDQPEDNFVLSFLDVGVRRSTIGGSLDPREGTWLDFAVEPGLGALGSSVDYVRLVAEGRAFHPLGPGVLAGRLRLGTIEPLAATSAEEIPVVKRFYSGGSNSVRGFEYQRLGPLDEDGDPLGGTSLLEASLEWRFPIWKALGGVVFTDAGQVALEPFTWRTGELFYSAGLGLRYRTPVGPLRIDYGWLLNPPDGVDRARLHLSVGHPF